MRIVFLGTPEFAVASLQALIDAGKNVVAVVTAPDKPAGRGQKLTHSPVKTCALANDIPVLQPEKLKNPDFLEDLKSFQADLQIVVAFRMLPEAVWNMPPLGTFNLHASLLPNYRGAAPINHAIINGEKETGVTTFFLKHEIDTGDLIFQEKEIIDDNDTVETLYNRLMEKGARLVVKTVEALERKEINTFPQIYRPETDKPAPKIFKEHCKIDWNLPAHDIRNLVRGLSPVPGAYTEINGKTYKIPAASIVSDESDKSAPGSILSDEKTYLHINTGKGILSIDSFKPEGKRAMSAREFFTGNKL